MKLIIYSFQLKQKMDKQRHQTQQFMTNVRLGSNQNQQKNEQIHVSFFHLFRFATKADWALMILGSFCAFIMGTAVPFLSVVWGTITDSFIDRDKMLEATKGAMFKTFGIAGGTLLAGWGMFACMKIAAQRQGAACRKQYLRSLLRQEMGWFDSINRLQLASQFVNEASDFQGAIGEKLTSIIMTISTLITSLIIAFVKGWLMSLVAIVSIPVVILGAKIYSHAIGKKNSEVEHEYSEAGGLSEQAISAIRTVKQLNGQQYEADRYAATLKKVTQTAIKYGPLIGLGYGLMYCTNFLSYGLSFWFGSNCVQDNSTCPSSLNNGQPYAAGDVLVVIFSIQQVGFIFLQFIPAIKKISQGRAAAANIFKIIDRKPLVASPPNGIKPQEFKGVFCFENVTFAYPKDLSYQIISNLSFQINTKSAAFVGQSGCGKSTIFQLMMRFYDPDQGRITLDGHDLRDLDLEWLRRQIGYVGQESFLFTGTIRQNLLLGKEDATLHEINRALRKAEAYDFVYSLRDKLETHTGTGGSQISGGQMQRLAIARTLLKNPKILLLDEATSALDRINQKKIQKTLKKISAQKWTITIAHNIRTIMHCKEIFVINKGSIQQVGAFWELRRFKEFHKRLMQMEQPSEQQVRAYIIELTKLNSLKVTNNPLAGTLVSAESALDEAAIKVKQEQEIKQPDEHSVFLRLLPYVKPRKGLFVLGVFTCICNGTIFPAIGIILSKMLFTLIFYSLDPVQGRKDANLYSLLFIILGIIFLILCVIQQYIFTIIGQEITEKVRGQIYHKILKMPMTWFQDKKNNWSSLSSRLASESMAINRITTFYITLIFQSVSNLIAGVIIAFVYQYNTALVAIGLVHLIIAFGAIYTAVAGGYSAQMEKEYKDSSSIITESMLSIRTIHSLAHEQTILRKYSEKLNIPLSKSVSRGNISGFLFGFSQCIMYISFAIILFLGSVFVRYYDVAVSDVFSATYPILFVGLNLINSAHFMPDINAAKMAAVNIFSILDADDEDQLQIKSKSKMLKTPIKGNIEFRNVCFKYESRDDEVFLDLNFEIKEGTKVGFVGASGCGKSTIHQLLQRFCDPSVGQILIDGVDIADYDIHHLRASLGIVNQDPTLFNETIANNIRYNHEGITQEQIMQAVNDAGFNPNQVISPVDWQEEVAAEKSGLDKNVGVKGSNVSGGQKQRLAIARMLIRRPSVLLFDEATSALDSATEKKVQSSLDSIMHGRTSIVIAHRIDTVKNSDAIFLFDQGEVVEVGTYDQLMWMKGMFYALQKEREPVQQQK